jgi:hypothetical protein
LKSNFPGLELVISIMISINLYFVIPSTLCLQTVKRLNNAIKLIAL